MVDVPLLKYKIQRETTRTEYTHLVHNAERPNVKSIKYRNCEDIACGANLKITA